MLQGIRMQQIQVHLATFAPSLGIPAASAHERIRAPRTSACPLVAAGNGLL
jgi:hypothetical protein